MATASAPPPQYGYGPAAGTSYGYGYAGGQGYGSAAGPYAAGTAASRERGETILAGGRAGRGLFTRPTGCDVLVGAFTAAALVSLFLPWYRLRASDEFGNTYNFVQTSALGTGAGGWRWVALAVSVGILLFLGVRLASRGEAPALPVRPTVVLATLAIVNLALLVVAFFTLPDGGFSVSAGGAVYGMAQAWGAFVGMAAAVLAATAGLLNRPGRAVLKS